MTVRWRHLSVDELVDAAEGVRLESSLPHLASCLQCQGRVADLRATLAAAADLDVPEPSPLFWDRLSARVREAAAREPRPHRLAFRDGVWWRRVAWPVAALAGVAVILLATFGPATRRLRAPGTTPAPGPDVAVGQWLAEPAGPELAGSLDGSPFDLVADLTAALEWEEVAEQLPLGSPLGEADEAMTEMTEAELQELGRLLRQELARSGA
jgi:hypothetical protein